MTIRHIVHRHLKRTMIVLLLTMSAWSLFAIPYTGGELTYKRISEGIYEFTLVLERDCNQNGGQAQFKDRATIGIFNMQNEILGDCGDEGKVQLKLQSVTKKKDNLESSCVDSKSEACREVAVYKATAFLAVSRYGYQFVYSDCCRPSDIKNFLNPGNKGFTLISTLSFDGFIWNTSIPVYNQNTPLYSCIGEENMINPEIAPKTGEEYRFSLCKPFDGKAPRKIELPPEAPPYDPIEYKNGYSSVNPLGDDGELSIDPNTGAITYTGNKAGSYMVAVCIMQYKNGRLVGSNIREINLNFTECSGGDVNADFDYTVDFCRSGRVMFENHSVGATEYEWTFYTNGSTSSTSSNTNPVMTFPSPGSYLVQLVAKDDNDCVDTVRKMVAVFDFEEDIQVLNFGNCNDLVQELKLNKPVRNYDIQWYLVEGGNETPMGSGEEISFEFPAEGRYQIRVVAEIQGCVVEATRMIQVVQGVTPLQDTVVLCEPAMVYLNPDFTSRYEYEWNIDSLVTDKNDPNPMVFVSTTTLFPVTITDSEDPDCTGEGFVLVIVDESIVSEFRAIQDLCSEDYLVRLQPVAENLSDIEWTVRIGGEEITSSEETFEVGFPMPGWYEVTFTATSADGCTATRSRMIEVFDPSEDLGIINFGNCEDYEQVLKINKPIEGYEITWSLVENGSLTEIGEGNEVRYDFGAEGLYTVQAELTDGECTIVVEDDLWVTLGVTVPRDTIDLCFSSGLILNPVAYDGYSYQWLNTNLIEDVNAPSPFVTVEKTTLFEVIVQDKEDPDCVDTGFVLVRINEIPVADFAAVYDICTVDKTMKFQPLYGDLARVTWIFDENDPSKTSNELTPSFTYDQFGEYRVTLIAESLQGCTDTLTKTVVVDDLFSFLNFTTYGGCEGMEYTFELNDPAIGYDVVWYIDNGTDLTRIGEGTSVRYAFDTEGKYDIRVSLANAECERSFVRSLNVYDGIKAPDTTIYICEPGKITLNPYGRNDLEYTWSPAGNLDDAASYNPVADITESTDFQVSVSLTYGDMTCSDEGTVRVILDDVQDSIAFDTSTISICEGDLVIFNEDGDASLNYYWQPESYFEDARIPSPSARLYTSQLFTATVTNPESECSVSFQKQVNVEELKDDIDIEYTFECGETKATLIAHDITGGIEWFYQDTLISEEPTFEFDFGGYGTFEVTASLTEECSRSTKKVTLFDPEDFLFQDTIYLCEPETVQLNPDGDSSLIYSWTGPNLSDNDIASPYAEVEGNSIYNAIILHPLDTTCQTRGRVYVFLESSSDIISASKTEFCMGDEAELKVGNGATAENVEWKDPDGEIIGTSATVTFPFEEIGEYTVQADFRGCTFRDTITLRFRNIELMVSENEGICPGEEVLLEVIFDASEAYDSIVWMPETVEVSSADPSMASIKPEASTEVSVHIYFSDGCVVMDTAMLRLSDGMDEFHITADRDTILRGEKATLTASNSTFSGYSWEPFEYVDHPNQAQTEVIPDRTMDFTLMAVDQHGCAVDKTITIVVLNPECRPPYIFVPRAFTPNADGANDILYVRGESIDRVHFVIYDRWGQKLFETNSKDVGWDGTFRGRNLPPDVYGYHLSVECIGGDTYEEKGNVTIIR